MCRISVITPLHNKGPYIAETINSVRHQTVIDWEMIVVENGSTDDGPEQVGAIVVRDPRIRLVRAPETVRGPGAARNIGIEGAIGEWILFLDADDLLDRRYLETMLQRALLDSYPMVVAAPWVEFEAGKSPMEGVVKRPAAMATGGLGIEDSAIAFTCWAVHAAIVRRDWLFDRRWPEELDGYLAEDTSFWFRVVSGAKVVYSNFAGAFYRTQTDNCRTDFSTRAWFEGNHRAAHANLDFLRKSGREPSHAQMETLVRHYEELYDKACRGGDREAAGEALVLANGWLKKHVSADGPQKTSMLIRRVLGISIFRYIKAMRRAFFKRRVP
jgi:glycosyltransferase involved in cell wall biosynthesis